MSRIVLSVLREQSISFVGFEEGSSEAISGGRACSESKWEIYASPPNHHPQRFSNEDPKEFHVTAKAITKAKC